MKSDHLGNHNNASCDYLDCDCEEYDFYCINMKTVPHKVLPEAILSSNYEKLNLEPYRRKYKGKELSMSNLDINGKPIKYL